MARHQPIKRNYEAGIWNKEKEDRPSEAERAAERERMMKEFLARGGAVEKLPPGVAKGGVGVWDRGSKPPTDAELRAQWEKEQANGSENTQNTGWDPRTAG